MKETNLSSSRNSKPTIAIIGAGFVGLSAAWDLVRQGCSVTIYESQSVPGGLASGFTTKEWDWSLEKHYHHIFQTDGDILKILKEMKLDHLVFFSSVRSSMLRDGELYQLDSPLSVLQFPLLSFFERLRMGLVLAVLKVFPWGLFFERWTAEVFLRTTLGERVWNIVWKPLLYGKFGRYAQNINMAWFWARIHARSKKLGYFSGGFLSLAEKMAEKLSNLGVTFMYNSKVDSVVELEKKFDKIIITTPSSVFSSLAPNLPQAYQKTISKLKGLGAVTLVLELDRPFFQDDTYWLNINEDKWPFLAVVEHTNLTGVNKYGDKSILYVGKYFESSDPFITKNSRELLKTYQSFLEELSPGFSQHITRHWRFTEHFAQPIVGKNHSTNVPSITTPLPNVFWASMQHIYPWDRGVNYAVRLGRRVADNIGNKAIIKEHI